MFGKIVLVTFLSLGLFTGCGGGGAKTAKIDVFGYACSSCSTKFYTTDNVSAEHCPQCKSGSIQEIATYVCSADKARTVALRSREGAKCKQCGMQIEAASFPTEEDMKTWGAAKKSKSEVGVK